MKTKKLAKELIEGVAAMKKLTGKDFVRTGSTALNLAITGKAYRGYAKGSYTLIVGDSSAGKTILAFTALAEAANNPEFDDYELVYDATTEDGAQFDVAKMFGTKLASRLKIVRSNIAEEFYYNLDTFLKNGKVFYVCDSENGLDSEAATEKFQKQKAAHAKGNEVPGSYGDGKARIHSQNIRRVVGALRGSESVLIMLSQTRDNIDPMSFETKSRSGGKALRFYAQVEYWIAIKKKLTVTVNNKQRQIGIISQCQVKRTRYTGKVRQAEVHIYYAVGVDGIGSDIAFLIEEGHWTGNGTTVSAPEFKFKGKIRDLVEKIERRGKENDLSLIVAEVWNEIEAKCAVTRKSKYA